MATLLQLKCTVALVVLLAPTATIVQCQKRRSATESETRALAQIRSALQDHELNLDYMKQDAWLLAWLRKRGHDVQATVAAVRAALQWRKENDVDNVLNEDFSTFLKQYPFDIEGVNRDGQPVWIFQLGKWDIRRVVLGGLQEKYDRYNIYIYELIAKKMRDMEKDGFLTIVDLAGFNLRQHGCIQCVQQTIKFEVAAESSYPYSYKSILVNAPRSWGSYFRTMKSLAPPSLARLYQGIEVYNFDKQEWDKVLLKYVAPDQLPKKYGGTRESYL